MYKIISLDKKPTAVLFVKGKIASEDFPARNKQSKIFMS